MRNAAGMVALPMAALWWATYDRSVGYVSDEELALALAEADERNIRIEIVNGIGLWHFQPALRHYEATTRIERSIRPDPKVGTDCRCFVAADVVIRFPDGSILRPDVAIFCRRPDEDDTAITLVPEAVVEVVSKGSEMKDFEIGPAFYLGQGVKDVIVFDPFSLLTIHHRRDRPPVRYSETTEIRLECGCLVTV